MSGIAGIVFSAPGPASGAAADGAAAVTRMLEAMQRRGPAGQVSCSVGNASLGLALFHSTPEHLLESGPTRFEHLVVVADVRLDNREDLLSALGLEPVRACSDSELLARSYLRWGEACAEQLRGDFAFAVWDQRACRLFCARDLFAIRPFYYAESAGSLVFGSSPEAVHASRCVRLTLDPVRLYDALTSKTLECQEPERSLYRELMRLPAGHALSYHDGRLRTWCYARLHPSSEPISRDEPEQHAQFRAHFERAVARRLRRVGPAAATLSGGLDSGAVVCSARELLRRGAEAPLITCSALNEPPYDQETRYVRAVQRGGDLECIELSARNLAEFGPEMADFLEQSISGPLDFCIGDMWLACALSIRRRGSSILLTGVNGDLSVGSAGDTTQRALREGSLWEAFALPLRETLAAQSDLREWGFGGLQSLSDFVQRDLVLPLTPALYWSRRRRRHRAMIARTHRPEVASLQGALEEELVARFRRARLPFEWPRDGHADHWLAHGVDRVMGGVGEAWDRVCNWSGVEARHPFLDRELVEFCMAVPWRERMRGPASKSLLRRSGLLPPEHTRQKVMFNANARAREAITRGAEVWLTARLAGAESVAGWLAPEYLRGLGEAWSRGDRSSTLLDQVLELATLTAWVGRWPELTQASGLRNT